MSSTNSATARGNVGHTTFTVLADHGDGDCFVGVRKVINGQVRFFPGTPWGFPLFRHVRMFIVGTLAWCRTFGEGENRVLVTYGSGTGFVIAFWQMLAKPFRRPITHFMFDLLMDSRRNGVLSLVDDFKTRIFNATVAKAVIWGKSDVARFSSEFGIDRDRLQFHPYHITLDDIPGFDCKPSDGGYVFCGGNVGRDFKTVIEAVGPLGIPLKIATQVSGVVELAEPFPNVEVRGVSPIEFREMLAGASMMVESHPKRFFRTAGHQTMLNAHFLGKPIVLSDRESADGYVRHGVDGLVLDAENVPALRAAVEDLWNDRNRMKEMGLAGRRKARRSIYGTLAHMESIYNLAIRQDCRDRGVSFSGRRIEIYRRSSSS